MSKFAYKAEGELNSEYLLDLTREYLGKLLEANDTKGIMEDDYKIDTTKPLFVQKFKDFFTRLFNSKNTIDNYNKVLSTKYVNATLNKIDIYLETNVLTSKQIFDLKQTLQAIKFSSVIPMIDEFREKAIKTSQKKFLKVLNDIQFLKNASSQYVLYNTPVNELKPFLSDKVSVHTIDYVELQKLIKRYVELKYIELHNFNFNPYEVQFVTNVELFYKESITDNGIGEDVENFIRSKMLEKLEILKHEELLPEELNQKINTINILLKKLKVGKIEKMMQDLIKLKTALAHAKEVMDSCKDTINQSTIPNKAQIFLVMDDLYYKLSKKCETLKEKTKLKLQLVDKQKMFSLLTTLENQSNKEDSKESDIFTRNKDNSIDSKKFNNSINLNNKDTLSQEQQKPSITSNLYDDEESHEIHIAEDDGSDDAEDEIIIAEDK